MEDKQNLTEQQKILLSKLETLRAEMHRSVDARVDRSIQRILTGSVLEESPTLPLHTDPSVFKGKKPEAVLFPNGQSVSTPTWKAAVLAILQDCNADPMMHTPHGIARQGYRQAAHHSRGLPGKDARAAGN